LDCHQAVLLPDGVQIWLARYGSGHLAAHAVTDALEPIQPGYRFLLITYVVGALAFQLTCPQWMKRRPEPPAPPNFDVTGDRRSIPIWPNVLTARWPPPISLTKGTLEDFCHRFDGGWSI
jgi:hypothetical protein